MKYVLVSKPKLRHAWFANELATRNVLAAHFTEDHRTSTEERVRSSAVLQRYFDEVSRCEQEVFAINEPQGVEPRAFGCWDSVVQYLERTEHVVPIIFGTSLIKGKELEVLMDRNAVNIHAGVSPYFRGSACNFWAMHDGYPELVGLTVHELTGAVDSGSIKYRFFGSDVGAVEYGPILYSMKQLRDGLKGAVEYFTDREFQAVTGSSAPDLSPHLLPEREIRVSRHSDFTEEIAHDFMTKYEF